MNRWNKRNGAQGELLSAGDSPRAPATYMEVAISIDNNRAYLPIPTLNLSIQRRYYRSGQTKFFMDRLSCGLKDITNVLQEHLHPESLAIWGVEHRALFINYSPKTLRQKWDASAGVLPNRKRIQTLQKHLERMQIDIAHIHQSLEVLTNLEYTAEDGKPSLGNASNERKERVDYLQHVLVSLNEDHRSTRETINVYKKSISDSFEMMFPLLQSTFTSELKRWHAPPVQLQLTNAKDYECSGIQINRNQIVLSQADQNRIAWAFWSASMHLLQLPICVVQVELPYESDPSMILEILNIISSTKQVIVFTSNSITIKGRDYYPSSGRSTGTSHNNDTSVFSTSDE